MRRLLRRQGWPWQDESKKDGRQKLNFRPAAEPVARDGWLPVKLQHNSVRPAPSASGGHRLNCHRPGPFRWTAAPSPAIYNVAGGTGASEGRGHSALPAL